MEDLLNGNYNNEEAIIQRAAQRGIDLKDKYVGMLVNIDRSNIENDDIRFMELKEKLQGEDRNGLFEQVPNKTKPFNLTLRLKGLDDR